MVSGRTDKLVVFFDGECALCNWGIQFLLKRDNKNKFLLASLQSPLAKEHFKNINDVEKDSVIVSHQGRIYTKSDAVLIALKEIGRGGQFFFVLKHIPQKLRNKIYDFVAKNRIKWFGATNFCRLPDSLSNF